MRKLHCGNNKITLVISFCARLDVVNQIYKKNRGKIYRLNRHVDITHHALGHPQPAAVSSATEARDDSIASNAKEPGSETCVLPGAGRLLQPVREDVPR